MVQKAKKPTPKPGMAKETPSPSPDRLTETTELATQEMADMEDLTAFLSQQAATFYTPGFAKIDVGKTGVFTSDIFEGGLEEIEGIILCMEPSRGLWAFGNDAEEAMLVEYFNKRPICSARHMNCVKGIGALSKVIDAEAPEYVRQVIKPITEEDFHCMAGKPEGCPYSAYGSHGAGMLCKENRRMLVYQPESRAFALLVATTTAIKNYENYTKGLPGGYSSVVTKFAIDVMEKGNNKWGRLRFKVAAPMSNDMIDPLRRKVVYQGQSMMEAKAVSMAFLGQELDVANEYDTNGVGATAAKDDDF